MTMQAFATWSRDYHDDHHHPDSPEPTCKFCAQVQAARQQLREEQEIADARAAKEEADYVIGLWLIRGFAIVLIVAGLLQILTKALPLNGTHFAGLGLMGTGAGLILRTRWVADRRAGR